MTQRSLPHLLGRAGAVTTEKRIASRPTAGSGDDGERHRLAAVATPALVALVASLAWSWRPSLWRDETASVSAATRPLADLPRLLSNVDAVHGLYYLLLHPFAAVSVDAWWLRLPSALAAGVAAALLAVLGHQLADARTGTVAGLLWALLPISSRYGMEARSVSISVALGLGATVVLVQALRRGRRWWAAYCLLVGFGAWFFLFSLLAVTGHAAMVLVARREGRRATGPFAVSVLIAGLLATPIALIAGSESRQLSWMTRPTLSGSVQLIGKLWFSGAKPLAAFMWVFVALGVAAGLLAWRRGGALLVSGCLALAGLPPVLLLSASQIRPLFEDRYVAVGAAYLALLAAFGLTRLRAGPVPVAAVVGAVVVAVASLPTWVADRRPDAWGDDFTSMAAVVAAHRQPGDEVFYSPRFISTVQFGYPEALGGLPDLGMAQSPPESGTIGGTLASAEVVTDRLADAKRVWVWQGRSVADGDSVEQQQRSVVAGAGWRVAGTWQSGWSHLELLVRP